MKLFKDLEKENRFYLFLLIGSFLLFAVLLSSPQAFWLHSLRWNKIQRHRNDTMVIPTNADSIDPEEWSTTNSTFEPEMQQPNRDQINVNPMESTNVEVEEESASNATLGTELQQPNANQFDENNLFDTTIDPESSTNNGTQDATGEKNEETVPTKPICDFSDWRSDICNMKGDVRTRGYNASTVFFVPPHGTFLPEEQQWSLNAYSEKVYMYFSNNVTVKQLRNPQDAPKCTAYSNTSAILISLGGPTGNFWHDFNNVLIPLFLASKPFNRDVQFIIINYHQWFLDKYNLILRDLSRYEIINFDEDKEIRCYPRMLVGLLNHKDFGIDPNRTVDSIDMFKFRTNIRTDYSLPGDVDIPYKMDSRPDKKPRLMLVVRSESRKFLNQQEVAEVIKKNGFELVQVEAKKNDNLTELSKLVDSCDVLMGVHGSGLTNFIFLRTNALMIQVIPLGGKTMDHYASVCFDKPAEEMKLRRIDYHIAPEESSLLETYGWDHPVIYDPDTVCARGWSDRQKYYFKEQDVRLNVTKFEPVLVKALEILKD